MPAPPDDPVRQRIRAVVDSIPPGRVATYGQVAAEACLPGRARLVGRTLAELPATTALPWHRVVAAPGRIAARPGGGAATQRRRLAREGVAVDARGRIDLARFGWRPEAADGVVGGGTAVPARRRGVPAPAPRNGPPRPGRGYGC